MDFMNSSLNFNETTEVNTVQTLDDPLLLIVKCYIHPAVGIIGLISNSFTFVLLHKDGFRKPSNIMILGLTVSDVCFLIRSIDATFITGKFGHSSDFAGMFGWETYENLAHFTFIIDRFVFVVTLLGEYVGTNMPVLITIERIIAVFFPLHFSQIVTPKRAAFAVCSIWLFWAPWSLFTSSWRMFYFITLPSGKTFGYRKATYVLTQNREIIAFLNRTIFNFLSSVVPISMVCIGCAFIGVKIKLTQRQRKLITAGSRNYSAKTTRTLVTLSLIFAAVHGSYFITTVVMDEMPDLSSNFILLVDEIKTTVVYMCASCNFFVYMIFNSKFRKMLIAMFSWD